MQAVKLHQLLEKRTQELGRIDGQIHSLKENYRQYHDNPRAQEAAIREVLGYLRKDELVFEFGE